jgi:Zn-dependent protease
MLRWRLFGISFCIEPSFWLMNALWAYILYAPIMGARRDQLITRELLILMLIWILCMLVAVMAHELGHVITGRIFGQPGSITLTGMGGQAVGGYDELSPWKRILVIVMGPCAGFLLAAALVALDGRYWNASMVWMSNNAPGGLFWESLKCEWFLITHILPDALAGWPNNPKYPIYAISLLILFMISLFMNIMNLLPIIPMDGGMIFKELCVLVSPRGGLKFAFIWSFALAVMASIYMLLVVLHRYDFIKQPDLYYPFAFPEFSLLIFASLAFQSFRVYQQLSAMERHSQYSQRDDY